MAKIERKPRRNIQYKDLANAVTHQDHLEFLEDVIPKAQSYKKIKEQAAARRAKVQGFNGPKNAAAGESTAAPPAATANGKKSKVAVNGAAGANGAGASSAPGSRRATLDAEDPSAQLELEMRQAHAGDDEDVEMTG